MTFFSIRHYALGAEPSTDYNERTSVMSCAMVVGSLGGIIFLIGAYQVVFAPTPDYANALLDPGAYRNLALLGVGAIGLPILLSAAVTQRAALAVAHAPGEERFGATRLVGEIRHAFSDRNFRALFGASVATGTIFGV